MSHPTGFNTTIFAYGQTGSGKTYSMQGVGGVGGEGAGIIPRMNEELFGRCVVGIARLSKAVVRAHGGEYRFGRMTQSLRLLQLLFLATVQV